MDTDDLLVAAIVGDVGGINKLLDGGCDPNAIHPQAGHSALYNATYADRVLAVTALLERGADPNLRLNYRSPVDGRQERGVVALMYALSVESAKALIDAGADVNAADEAGTTALMRAVHRGHTEIVRLLLDARAEPRHKTINGQSAHDIAQSQIARYESWVVGTDRAPIAGKVRRLEQICAILADATS